MEYFNRIGELLIEFLPFLIVIVFGVVMIIIRTRLINKKSNLKKHLKALWYILLAAGFAIMLFYYIMPRTITLESFSYADINHISDPEKLLEMLLESVDVTVRLNTIFGSVLLLLFMILMYMGGIIRNILKKDPMFKQQ